MTTLLTLLRRLFPRRERHIETVTVGHRIYEVRDGRLYATSPVSTLPPGILERVL